MRKELKMIGSKERHVFTATFIRFGFRDGYKGPVRTILLQDRAMWLSSAQGLAFTRKDIKDTGMMYSVDR